MKTNYMMQKVSLASMLLLATACSLTPKKDLVNYARPSEFDINSLILGTGSRDFVQTYKTMGVLTGIDTSTAGPANNEYNSVRNNLMTSVNDPRTLSATVTVAQARLASRFCDILNGAANRLDYFPGTTNTSFPDAARDGVITALLQKFLLEPSPAAEQVEVLRSLHSDLKAGGANGQGLNVALCTAVLASAKSTVLN
ncbi:MAG: hypothetical protein AB7P04_15455 [Bacteriovoracia bacterium]